MRIRSITTFFVPDMKNGNSDLSRLAGLSRLFREKVELELIEVQSARLATTPFPSFVDYQHLNSSISAIKQLEEQSRQLGWDYLSLGPALPEQPESYAVIPEILKATSSVFCSAVIAGTGQLFPTAIQTVAKVILQNAIFTPDGFTNLRFAALANVPAYTPFFPAAYHKPGNPPAVSIAMECADVVLQTLQTATSLDAAKNEILSRFEKVASKIETIFDEIYAGTGVEFVGFDFSPAPFPEDWCSLGAGIEALTSGSVGQAGSLAAAAIIADLLDRGKWKRSGFNGLMLPVMEDSILARRAADGTMTIKDLLLYSSVCGTGLDTIPLSGDTSEAVIGGMLFDLAALSIRLAKPLTARLMPIPGLKTGDATQFHFDYFANSRTMPMTGHEIISLLTSQPEIQISPRKVARK